MKKPIIAFTIMAAILSSCGGGASGKAQAQPAPEETQVVIKTDEGNITLKLYNETPFHRDNFIKLVEEHYYDSILFHRVIKNFMIQAGDPDSKTAQKGDTLGTGGPAYRIPAEIKFPQLYHKRGALCAARQADQVNPERASSGSQFYIVTGKKYTPDALKDLEVQLRNQEAQSLFYSLCAEKNDSIRTLQQNNDQAGLQQLQEELVRQTQALIEKKGGAFKFTKEIVAAYTSVGGTPSLDGQYTVFGEVTDGMDIVDKIQKAATDGRDRPRKDIRIISMEIK